MSNPGLLIFRVMVGLLLAVVLLVAALIFAPDEAPSELSNAMRTHGLSAVDTYAEGFIYQLGIGAPIGKDPARFGMARINAYQEAMSQPMDDSFEYREKISANELPLMDTKEWGSCSLDQWQCIGALLTDESRLNRLVLQSEEIYKRYEHLLSLQHHENTLLTRFDEPDVHMQYLSQGNFALIFRALKAAIVDSDESVTAILMADVTRLRELLAGANTVVSKVVYCAAIARDIYVLNALQVWGLAAPTGELPELTRQELSFARPLAREFAMNALMFDRLSESRNAFSFDFELPTWVLHSTFKKNMFLNQLAVRMNRFIENAERSPQAFSTAEVPSEIGWLGMLFNPIGSAYIKIADDINFDNYSSRTQDLNKQIILYNQIRQGRNQWSESSSYQLGFHQGDASLVCFDRHRPSKDMSKEICLVTSAQRSEP